MERKSFLCFHCGVLVNMILLTTSSYVTYKPFLSKLTYTLFWAHTHMSEHEQIRGFQRHIDNHIPLAMDNSTTERVHNARHQNTWHSILPSHKTKNCFPWKLRTLLYCPYSKKPVKTKWRACYVKLSRWEHLSSKI